MLMLGGRAFGSKFEVLLLIFMPLADNVSSPVGKQFIRPSGLLFNGSPQAETEFRALDCGQHAGLR